MGRFFEESFVDLTDFSGFFRDSVVLFSVDIFISKMPHIIFLDIFLTSIISHFRSQRVCVCLFVFVSPLSHGGG